MVKHVTIRILITIALSHGWILRQLDINNTSFNGTLQDEMFIRQLVRLIDKTHPKHAYHMKKSLYGLK